MKKLLFCAGVLALAISSCTDEYDSFSAQQQTRGIAFVAGNEDVAVTKGFFTEGVEGGETVYMPFWWAEQDRITIIGKNIKKGYPVATGTEYSAWGTSNLADQKATYKATQSQRSGVFTSVNDANMLNFLANSKNPAEFLAIYPADDNTNYKVSSSTAGTFEVKGLKNLTAQTQTDTLGGGIYNNMLKWDYVTAMPEESYDAVGEKIELNFQREFSGIVFKTANAERYTKGGAESIFGNLMTVEAKLGQYQSDAFVQTGVPALAYDKDNAALTIKVPTAQGEVETSTFNAGTVTDNKYKTVMLTMNDASGLAWSDGARAYMVVLPIKLASVEKPILKVTYTFDNITFETEYPMTQKDWEKGKFYNVPELDINKYDYLLTDKKTSNDRTLIVNRGNFSSVFDANGNVIWPIGGSTGVAKSEIGTIIVAKDVVVTENDVKGLSNFTNLTSVEMPQVTNLPDGTFTATQAPNLKTIVMPAVTAVGEKFAGAALTALENLDLAAYPFDKENVNKLFFNENNKGTLKTLNISGVSSMTPSFGVERTLSFQGYGKLEEVTVQDGVDVCANAFNGCTELEEVNGIVDLLNGTSAFEGCENLAVIKINGTEIPARAFYRCKKLTQILNNGEQVIPTKIGEYAFGGVAAEASPANLYMDLKNATEIGNNAFLNSSLTSGKQGSRILTVGATSVKNNAFNGTKVQMVQFLNAESIEDGALAGTTALIQVKFLKPFKYVGAIGSTPSANIFGGSRTGNSVYLFVCSDQTGWSGTTLTLTNGSNSQTYKFKNITIENEPYGEE